jgi:carboxypeptidase C (cathepsin A)
MKSSTSILAIVSLSAAVCMAQTTHSAQSQPAKDARRAQGAPKEAVEKASVTEGSVTIGGKALKYRATAATMPMSDEHGEVKATVFFVAYDRLADKSPETKSSKAEAASPNRRPITFVFNGGPGAASVWLHLGAAGPKRVALDKNGTPPDPPYSLVENDCSWLDVTDLVFIDPVGTGFSRPAKGEKREQFYGVKQDVQWVADFIRRYVTRYQRWLSPMFLAGESYGTTRAAALSEYLLDRYGIALNGVILISPVLDYQTILLERGNDLPYVLYLPTYAALAWYHKKLSPPLQADLNKTLSEVQTWALGGYAAALAQGSKLSEADRRAVAERLQRYTSLPADFIDKSDLRIKPTAFRKRLLGDERRVIGRFDGRIAGADLEPASDRPGYDPSLSGYFATYSSTFNDYVRRVLKFESPLPYEVLSNKVWPWKYMEGGQGYLSVAENLQTAMVKNRHLRVMFASGYFDLATPFLASDYVVRHLGLSKELESNISGAKYMGGHMMYHNPASLAKLKSDIATFVKSAL